MPTNSEDSFISPANVSGSSKKTNDDFRKLLMTPRSSASNVTSSHDAAASFSRRPAPGPGISTGIDKRSQSSKKDGNSGGAKFKRKSHHTGGGANAGDGGNVRKEKKEGEDDTLGEILKNYRDRAAERREGESTKGGMMGGSELDMLKLTGAYRAVPADARATYDAAERRKQAIHESKYLGGDMEHTHLVKGLDFSLLQKVRGEIEHKEREDDEALDAVFHSVEDREGTENSIKSTMAKNIYRILFKDNPPKVNELFGLRRMAYVVEMDDDAADSDIPTTLLRSKQDCPIDETNANLSTNDMVIQKLTQVLSYLRADTKKKKKDRVGDELPAKTAVNNTIFDDVGEYVPNLKKDSSTKQKVQESYFEKSESINTKDDAVRDRKDDERRSGREITTTTDRHSNREKESSRRDASDKGHNEKMEKSIVDRKDHHHSVTATTTTTSETNTRGASSRKNVAAPVPSTTAISAPRSRGDIQLTAVDSYAECYPGGIAVMVGESDDEADYSKMDLGNRKGPVKRWDFDSSEDYEKYMDQREAMPKAAYQYGVKMNDGRRTRKSAPTDKDSKQKIDRQLNDITRMLDKRKHTAGEAKDLAKRIKY